MMRSHIDELGNQAVITVTCHNGTTREKEMSEWQIEVRYQMRCWLAFRAGIIRQSNDSSITSLEYDSTIYSIGVEMEP